MTTPRRGARRAAVGVAVVLVSLSASPARASVTTDRAAARDALLEISDFPGDGWEDEGSSGPDSPLPDDPSCDDLRRAERVAKPRAVHGPSFAHTDAVVDAETETTIETERGAEQSIVVFATVKTAKRYFAAYDAPEALECFEASLEEPAVDDGPTLDAQRIGRDDAVAASGLGDAAVGYSLDAEIVFEGEAVGPIGFSARVYRVGRAVTRLTLSTVDSLDPVPEADAIAAAAVARLEEVD